MSAESKREKIEALLAARFGDAHACSVDIGALLRTEEACNVRFFHHGIAWDLKQVGGSVELSGVEK